MKHFLCIILLLSSHLLYSQSSRINLSGKVKFVSDAPLEIIKAESEKLTGIIDFASNSFAFTVNLKSFEGFNSALQKEHFHENYLESEDYPAITYTGKVLDKIDWTQDGTYEVRTKGKFNIHGIAKERILKNKIIVKNGKVKIISSFNIALADYNITIPRIVHKKIAEEIDISLEIIQSL
jgi:polyisoprenoid-binding protein YceI